MAKKWDEESFDALGLDRYLSEATAGADDLWIASMCDAPVSTVRAWRNARGIKKSSGPGGSADGTRFALAGLSSGFEPVLHITGNALGGAWQQPEFVLREALDYSAFCRAVWGCHDALQMSVDAVAEAFGVRAPDVVAAIAVWKRHLHAKGKRCLGCQVYIDPRFGEFCCRSCHDAVTSEVGDV